MWKEVLGLFCFAGLLSFYLIAYAHSAGPRSEEHFLFYVCYVCGFARLWFMGLLRVLALCVYGLKVFEKEA